MSLSTSPNQTTEQLSLLPASRPDLDLTWIKTDAVQLPMLRGAQPSHALIENIRRLGILEPIKVRAMGGDQWRVIDGRRRYMAARELGFERIPVAIVSDFDGASADPIVSLSSHALRSVNLSAEVDDIEALMAEGAAIQQISSITGLTAAAVKMRLGLLNLTPGLREALQMGEISPSVAQAAAKLPDSVQAQLLDTFHENGRLTSADIKAARLARTQGQLRTLPLADLDADLPDDLTLLQQAIEYLEPIEALPVERPYREKFEQAQDAIRRALLVLRQAAS